MDDTNIELVDDGAFSVFTTRFGLWASRDKDGKQLCTSMSKEAVIYWSREHLRGFPTSTAYTTKVSTHGDPLKS